MSDEALDAAVDEVAEGLPRRKMSGKKIVLFIVLPLLLVGGAAAGLFLTGMIGGSAEHGEDGHAVAEAGHGSGHGDEGVGHAGFFYDLPDIIVNLNTDERRQVFLSMSVSLELADETKVEHVEQIMPRIIDSFQMYLRELRMEDLRGSAGLYRLREELLRRVSASAPEAEIRDVLFREMLVQ